MKDFAVIDCEGQAHLTLKALDLKLLKNRRVLKQLTETSYQALDLKGQAVADPFTASELRVVSGAIIIIKNDREGILDYDGSVILEPRFSNICYFDDDGFAVVSRMGKEGIVNHQGEMVVPLKYNELSRFPEGTFVGSIGKKEYFVKTDGSPPTEPPFEDCCPFSCGRTYVRKSKDDARFGFIDEQGNLVIPYLFDDANSFQDNRAAVRRDGKNGHIDLFGNETTPLCYEDASSFYCERAAVRHDGLWGLVDLDGKFVIPPKSRIESAYSYDVVRLHVEGKSELYCKEGKRLATFRFIGPFVEGLAIAKI